MVSSKFQSEVYFAVCKVRFWRFCPPYGVQDGDAKGQLRQLLSFLAEALLEAGLIAVDVLLQQRLEQT